MCGKLAGTSKLAAFLLVTINFTTMVLCMAVFAISLWVIASPESLVQTIQLFGNSTLNLLVMDASVQVGISGALISGFIFFISAMGLYGAVTGSQFLLFMYGTLVILMMLLECALLYYFSSNITEKGLQEQDCFVNHALRVLFRCCDQKNTTSVTIPWSCCDVVHLGNCTTDNIYRNDCRTEFILWLNKYQTVIYATLAVVHVLLSSCSLLRRSRSSRSDT